MKNLYLQFFCFLNFCRIQGLNMTPSLAQISKLIGTDRLRDRHIECWEFNIYFNLFVQKIWIHFYFHFAMNSCGQLVEQFALIFENISFMFLDTLKLGMWNQSVYMSYLTLLNSELVLLINFNQIYTYRLVWLWFNSTSTCYPPCQCLHLGHFLHAVR